MLSKEERVNQYKRYESIRDSKGLTDYKVAKTAGIHMSTFTDWKTGRCAPKTDKLVRIAKAMRVGVTKLM